MTFMRLSSALTNVAFLLCSAVGASAQSATYSNIAFTALTDASPIAWVTGGLPQNNASVTLSHSTGTRALNVSRMQAGDYFLLVISQDSTGGAALTGGTGCTWVNAGGGTAAFAINQAANSVSVLTGIYDGTNCYFTIPVGMTASTANDVATFLDTSGNLKDSGVAISSLLTAAQGSISAGPTTFGSQTVNAVIVQTIAAQAGHFTNLSITTTAGGGTCTTAPTFNVFDGTTNTGTAKQATTSTQTKGNTTNQTQTLTFASGDKIGIYISTAGSSCTTNTWTVTAQYSTP